MKNPIVQLAVEQVLSVHGLPDSDRFLRLESNVLKCKSVTMATAILGEVAAIGYSMGYTSQEVKAATRLFDAISLVPASRMISGAAA